MRLDAARCWSRLATARHGVLASVHPTRGVDAVPVVFAIVDGRLVLPIDTVKPKSTSASTAGGRLQRLANLDADPRCSLLVDHYDDDWAQLWWVRVHAQAAAVATPTAPMLAALAHRYPQYRAAGAVPEVVVLAPGAITGWSGQR